MTFIRQDPLLLPFFEILDVALALVYKKSVWSLGLVWVWAKYHLALKAPLYEKVSYCPGSGFWLPENVWREKKSSWVLGFRGRRRKGGREGAMCTDSRTSYLSPSFSHTTFPPLFSLPLSLTKEQVLYNC